MDYTKLKPLYQRLPRPVSTFLKWAAGTVFVLFLIPAIIVAVIGADPELWVFYLPYLLDLPWFIQAPIWISVVLGFVLWLEFKFTDSSEDADSEDSGSKVDKRPE